MKKVRFSSIYLLTLAVIFLALGGYTEWHYLHDNVPLENASDTSIGYLEFLHLIFFFLGFLTISSIYFLEKREAKTLSLVNIALQKEIDERRRVEKERERLISELQKALDEVNTLSGLLPICASCKKIRDDKGYWNQIESYISDRSEAEFSHGICPECAKELYPEFFKKDGDKGRP